VTAASIARSVWARLTEVGSEDVRVTLELESFASLRLDLYEPQPQLGGNFSGSGLAQRWVVSNGCPTAFNIDFEGFEHKIGSSSVNSGALRYPEFELISDPVSVGFQVSQGKKLYFEREPTHSYVQVSVPDAEYGGSHASMFSRGDLAFFADAQPVQLSHAGSRTTSFELAPLPAASFDDGRLLTDDWLSACVNFSAQYSPTQLGIEASAKSATFSGVTGSITVGSQRHDVTALDRLLLEVNTNAVLPSAIHLELRDDSLRVIASDATPTLNGDDLRRSAWDRRPAILDDYVLGIASGASLTAGTWALSWAWRTRRTTNGRGRNRR
jgi:hypothetical protein